MLPITVIEATTIPDAWFQCIYNILDEGFRYDIQHGSFVGEQRIEFDFVVVQISRPYAEPYDLMLPDIPSHLGIPNPVEKGYVEQYLPYLMTDKKQEGEDYTYGERLNKIVIDYDEANGPTFGSQIEYLINVLKNTPNTNQVVLQVARPSDCLLQDPPCVVGDTLILTNKGYKKAIDVKEGDFVLTHLGNFKRVTKCFETYYTGKLQTVYGGIKNLIITPEHPLYVTEYDFCYDNKMVCKNICKKQYSCYEKNGSTCKKSYENYTKEWINACNIGFGKYISLYPKLNIYNNFIDSKYNEKQMWLFGLFIADGDYTKKDGIRFNLGSHEIEIIDKCISYMKDVSGLDPHIQLSNKGNSCTRISFYSREIYTQFYNMFGKYAYAKKIPFEFIYLNENKIKKFIDGCIDGDGHIRKNNKRKIEYYTTSENVKLIFELLLNKLLIIPSIIEVEPKDSKINGRIIRGNYKGYLITWTKDKVKNTGKWFSDNYKNTFIYTDNHILLTKCKVYNFEVEDDNSYIANGITVHNCLRHIDVRVKDKYYFQDGEKFYIGKQLIFYPYFRSWDLWGGFPANLAGIAVLQKYMADEIGVESGPIIASSKGLHIYGYAEELVKLRTCRGS